MRLNRRMFLLKSAGLASFSLLAAACGGDQQALKAVEPTKPAAVAAIPGARTTGSTLVVPQGLRIDLRGKTWFKGGGVSLTVWGLHRDNNLPG